MHCWNPGDTAAINALISITYNAFWWDELSEPAVYGRADRRRRDGNTLRHGRRALDGLDHLSLRTHQRKLRIAETAGQSPTWAA